ncbi:hypothetical protein [Nocardia sp. NPDC050435]|uniref:hypothetical protein n=1 Tax=Nocardia sp. NPDC050435 TaxID=3155040 RepID=UPI0034072FF8
MSTDPWDRAGALYIPSDFADVPPVPPGTKVGNVHEMAVAGAKFHASTAELARHPEKLRAAVDKLVEHWDPQAFDRKIGDAVRTRVEEQKAAGRRSPADDDSDPPSGEPVLAGASSGAHPDGGASGGTHLTSSIETSRTERLWLRIRAALGRGIFAHSPRVAS